MGTLSVSLHPERPAIASKGVARLYVAMQIDATGEPLEKRPPISTVLALDASGSMAGPPIEHVIASVEAIADLVEDSDSLGVVLFADRGSVFMPMTAMNETGRRLLKGRVRRIRADGHTNIEDALLKSADMLVNEPTSHRRSIVLLSDGEPNRGSSTAEQLGAIAHAMRSSSGVSTLGFGARHNEDILSAISDSGGGRYHFIQDAKLCKRQIAIALGAQADVVVDDIELLVRPAQGVELTRFVAQPTARFKNGGAAIAVADMENDSRRILAFELIIAPEQVLMGRLADIEIRFRDPKTQASEVWAGAVTIDVRDHDAPATPSASALILLARAEEERSNARNLADRGQFDGAAAVLRKLLLEIEQSPAYVANDGSDLWETHELLVDEIAAFERRPDAEAYSVFRKQTMHLKVTDHAPSQISIRRGTNSSRFLVDAALPGYFPPAKLEIVGGPGVGQIYNVGQRCTMGRTTAAEVVLQSPDVSRRHAEIFAQEGAHWISDLGSTNATKVNNQRLGSEPRRLQNSDLIQVGDVFLRYQF